MSESQAVHAASRRLTDALDALEAAMDRQRETDRSLAGRDAQLHAFGNDRARLAAELDAVSARARRLEEANRAIAGRLDQAMDTIRTVIEVG
jgi:hypothetical protein